MTGAGTRGLTNGVRASAAFFVVVGAAAVAVGFHDLLFARQLTFRFVAVGVFVLGVALLAAAYGFFRRRMWSYSTAFGAALAGFAFGVMFVVTQWVNTIHDYRLALWAAITAGFGLSAVGVAREGRLSFGRLAKRRARVASSLLSVGALLSIANFWNTAVRVPPTAAPSVTLTTSLTALAKRDGMIPVEATITATNSASTNIRVLGSLYVLWGGTVVSTPDTEAGLRRDFAVAAKNNWYGKVTPLRGAEKSFDEVASAGKWIQEESYFVPHEQYAVHPVFYVRPGRFSWLRLEAQVVIAKDTIPLDDDAVVKTQRRGDRLVLTLPLSEKSWLSRAFRGRREVRSDVVLASEGAEDFQPWLDTWIGRRGDDDDAASAFSLRMSRLYGLASTDSAYEIALRK